MHIRIALRKTNPNGFGLVIVLLLILGLTLTATIVFSSAQDLTFRNNITQTQVTLRNLAIAVSSSNITPVPTNQRSYEQDVGALPGTLNDLITKPGSVAACAFAASTSTLSGWCGPYWSVPFANQTTFADSWANPIIYDSSGRRVYSIGPNAINETGGGDDLVQNF